ncbi:type I restriction-modification system subunit M N-terminal domain-containing protein [Psychrobacter sp. K31L]|uniref:type I restriction-modification system subunit M N-terminal domain-containing protein n=1 Tax=Psychrobacter sp. K31L TaxID=2820758 RepID=UPI001B31FC92|nr:type I restriction-modification system subunit M N-terminal domain-containing protein [Psychrobacter sp. K31L]MBP3945948.1 type I restriction-modification system subunit M N-terminal domain-containing protein [Psychrobacter sp. K31L]
MAKTTTKKNDKKEVRFEKSLRDATNKLRGSVESLEYKHIVLSLIFLKFISDTFEKRKHELIETG